MKAKFKCPEINTPCSYRQEGYCIFWERAGIIPGAFDKVFPDDDSLEPLLHIDTFREPCLEEDDKRRDCSRFFIPGEQGWLKCESCNQSECSFL